jgi:hypothetical protein
MWPGGSGSVHSVRTLPDTFLDFRSPANTALLQEPKGCLTVQVESACFRALHILIRSHV